MAAALLFGFLVLIMIGVPISFAMGSITIAGFFATGGSMMIIAQKLFSGMDNFTYLCIPLYILASEIMASGRLTEKIVHFCDGLVGHVTGGLAHVNIMGSMLFAGISGSATADASGLGRIEIDIMDKAGYPRPYAGAVTAASAIIGPIIPPSGIMIIYAVVAGNVSVAAMFMAGILPGILLGLLEMCLAYYLAKKRNHPKRAGRTSRREILRSAKETLPCLLLPVIILGGIASGVFTATESGAVAILYAIIIAGPVMGTLSWREFWNCCSRTAKTTANVLFIIAVASAMGWAITTLQVPQRIIGFCMEYIHSPLLFLVFVNILLLVIGMILDQSPALLIMVPILLPVATAYGIDPLHFGVVVCVNLTVGLITPPVGMTLFVTSNVGRIKLTDLYREIMPFVVVCLLMLLLVTFVPQLTLAIPRWIM